MPGHFNYFMSANYFILLAEDDEDDQELIQMAFKKITSRHHFKIVNNGQEALDALLHQKNLPCLIILDLNMPMLNGIQTLKALMHDPKYEKIPKVILTTSDSEDNRVISYSNGAVDYFVKPGTLPELVMTAQKMLSYCQ